MGWKERIAGAKKRGFFTDKDKELSNGFNTCAVGEHLGLVKLSDHEAWEKQWEKGVTKVAVSFDSAVREDNFSKATKLYSRIQKMGAF